MNTNFIKQCILSLIAVSLLACNKKAATESDDNSVDSVTAMAESAVTMVSGMADEQSNSSFAMLPRSESPLLINLLLQQAYASNCQRAVLASCNNGVRSESYDDCAIAGTQASLDGQITLTYSSSVCSMITDGDTVTRSYEMQINGPRGGVLTSSSAQKADYRGASYTYGGGGRLTKTASGFDLEVLGKHNSLNYRGLELFNVSVRTISPIAITGGLNRSQRVANGGSLEINHNKAGYTALWSFSDVRWSNTCCHPVSGNVNIVFSGTKTGQATLTFDGCGSGHVTQDGQSQQVGFSYCE